MLTFDCQSSNEYLVLTSFLNFALPADEDDDDRLGMKQSFQVKHWKKKTPNKRHFLSQQGNSTREAKGRMQSLNEDFINPVNCLRPVTEIHCPNKMICHKSAPWWPWTGIAACQKYLQFPARFAPSLGLFWGKCTSLKTCKSSNSQHKHRSNPSVSPHRQATLSAQLH